MSARDTIFASIRSSLGVNGQEAPRRKVVADRIASHPAGIVPKRGQLPARERVALFAKMLEDAAGSLTPVATAADVPVAVGDFLRRHNLPLAVRRGDDALLAGLPWQREPALEVSTGPSDGRQLASISHAFGGVAETGTHGTTLDCVVRNFTDQGACIEVDRGGRLPEQVNLSVARKGRSSLAEVIWRQANMVGLAFRTMFTETPESDLDARLRRSEKKKRELQRRIKQLLGEG